MEFSVSNEIFEFCKNNNISCDETTATEFDVLCQSLIEFNSHTNVTALKTYEDICKKHFIDSIYVLKYDLLKPGAAVIDIGCGAGFPGLPVKMLRNDIDMTFVDSTAKKLKFTEYAAKQFGFDVTLFAERAEELVSKGHREKYDAALSRAVAALPVLCELVLPYVKVGGIFVAYKSKKEADLNDKNSELSLAQNAIKSLGARASKVLDAGFTASNGVLQEHSLVVIEKVKKTPPQYPRRYAAILKKPL